MDISLSFEEQIYKTPIDFGAKFALIGNNIDGFVGVEVITFATYSDLKEKLPAVLVGLECFGEWNLTLYQYHGTMQMNVVHGYYKSVVGGTVLFKYDYMHLPVVQMDFFDNRAVLVCANVEASENWNPDTDDFQMFDVCTEIITLAFSTNTVTF